MWDLIGKEVTFTFKARKNATVQVAGDFNNWMPEDLHSTDTPSGPKWQKVVWLNRGSYQYKYLLDGVWITDPTNFETVQNSFGGQNSLIAI